MPTPERRPRGRAVLRTAILGLAAVVATGCASWKTTELTPQQVFATERPEQVRVTTNDGAITTLRQPRVLGNVLAGYDEGCVDDFGLNTGQCEEQGISVFEIQQLELLERGPVGQVALAVSLLALVWLLTNR